MRERYNWEYLGVWVGVDGGRGRQYVGKCSDVWVCVGLIDVRCSSL